MGFERRGALGALERLLAAIQTFSYECDNNLNIYVFPSIRASVRIFHRLIDIKRIHMTDPRNARALMRPM